MTNRTIQFFGQGYGTTAITANVQLNGNTVFTGEIPTVDQSVSVFPLDQVDIFNFELPLDTVGPVSVAILFTGAETVYVEQVLANYVAPIANPVYTPQQLAILSNSSTPQAEKLPIFESAANPPLTNADILVLQNGTPEERAPVLKEHNLQLMLPDPDQFVSLPLIQAKTNVVINAIGVEPSDDSPGEWGWQVPLIDGTGTMSFDLLLPAPPA
jgi:hypothetical protein